jgi:hypothetical protein
VAGEAILATRLIRREQESDDLESAKPGLTEPNSFAQALLRPNWGNAFRQESGKWGLFLTMIVFTCLLNDRVAEALAAGSVLIWIMLNWRLAAR